MWGGLLLNSCTNVNNSLEQVGLMWHHHCRAEGQLPVRFSSRCSFRYDCVHLLTIGSKAPSDRCPEEGVPEEEEKSYHDEQPRGSFQVQRRFRPRDANPRPHLLYNRVHTDTPPYMSTDIYIYIYTDERSTYEEIQMRTDT